MASPRRHAGIPWGPTAVEFRHRGETYTKGTQRIPERNRSLAHGENGLRVPKWFAMYRNGVDAQEVSAKLSEAVNRDRSAVLRVGEGSED